MPRRDYCTLRFIQQLLQGVKVMQKQNEAAEDPDVPNWPELAVHKVWKHAEKLPGLLDRLPDEWQGGRRTDRQFFWASLIAIHEGWAMNLIDNCARQRKARKVKVKVQQQINMPIRVDIARMLVAHETGIKLGKSRDQTVTVLFNI